MISLGEIMLRLDPGEGRIRTARDFKAWEGGGEYNIARGLRKCFGLRPPSAPRSWTTTSAISSRISSCRAAWTRISSSGAPIDGIGRTRAQRPEFHRARFRHARRGRHSRPRQFRRQPAQARRFRLGQHFRQARRALVAHRRHFRRVVRHHAATRHRSGQGGQASTARSSATI